jgi:hypothetical protein
MIRRLQIQLRAGQQTDPFVHTEDLVTTLMAWAETSMKLANEAKREDEKHHHLARREAFLDTANELMPA